MIGVRMRILRREDVCGVDEVCGGCGSSIEICVALCPGNRVAALALCPNNRVAAGSLVERCVVP